MPAKRPSRMASLGSPGDSPDVAKRRKRIVAFCTGLPGVVAEPKHQHIGFKARKQFFAYYVFDHHGDGRVALLLKAPPGEQELLLRENPDLYFFPPYVGPKGWVGVRVDSRRVDWKNVERLLSVAYYLTGPEGRFRP